MQSRPEPASLERQLLVAMLDCVGEFTYPGTTLEAVLQQAGSNNRDFRRHFESFEACFEKACGLKAEELCTELIAVGRGETSWPKGVRAGLTRLLGFVSERPNLARTILLESRFAGKGAMERQAELVAGLCIELDTVRGQIESERQPPEATAQMAVGGVKFLVGVAIASRKPVESEELLKELGYFVVMLYLGREAAAEEFGGGG